MKKMKLVLIAFGLLLFASCHKETEDPYEGLTRYSIIGEIPSAAASMLTKVKVYEYNAMDVRIDSNIIEEPTSHKEYIFLPNDSASHVKVRLYSKAGNSRWGDTIVMLVPQKKVTIRIKLTSPESTHEPMLNQ